MKISACMIAKNEEKVIARCIESYRAAVNEVIVVDTGSADRTKEIAKELGAKVFYFAWIDDFAAAKNYAISKAKGDWIVFLDADEYFGDNTANNLRAFLKRLDASYNSVACKMVNIDQISGKVLDVITHVRIFKNDKNIRYVNPIHEMLQHKAQGQKINAFLADAKDLVIYHTGYSYDNRQEKARRNLEMLLRELPQAEAKPGYYQYIADCYFALGEWEKVIEYSRKVLGSGVRFAGYNVRVHHNLIDAMLQLKHPVKNIMGEIDAAIEKYPYHPLFRFYKGNVMYELKQYDAAFAEYQQTLRLHKNYDAVEINSLPVNLWMVYNVMGAISEHRNDCAAAVDYYLETLKLDKHNAPCFDRLIMMIRTQPLEDIILLLNKLYDLEDENDLDFLAARLVNHPLPRALAYYANLRQKKNAKQDFIVLQMLVANGHYHKAFSALLDCYGQDGDERLATVAAAAALLSREQQHVDRCLESLPESLTKIIKAYYGEDADFSESDKPALMSLIHIFIIWADDASLERLLAVSGKFPGGMAAEIGSAFINKGYYRAGLQFYEQALQTAFALQQPVKPSLYFNQGYCLHRLGECAAAAQAFVNAYGAGYTDNDIYQFLRWNLARMDESNGLRGRIEEILRDGNENNEKGQS